MKIPKVSSGSIQLDVLDKSRSLFQESRFSKCDVCAAIKEGRKRTLRNGLSAS